MAKWKKQDQDESLRPSHCFVMSQNTEIHLIAFFGHGMRETNQDNKIDVMCFPYFRGRGRARVKEIMLKGMRCPINSGLPDEKIWLSPLLCNRF